MAKQPETPEGITGDCPDMASDNSLSEKGNGTRGKQQEVLRARTIDQINHVINNQRHLAQLHAEKEEFFMALRSQQ